jgi:hypothetical protein
MPSEILKSTLSLSIAAVLASYNRFLDSRFHREEQTLIVIEKGAFLWATMVSTAGRR